MKERTIKRSQLNNTLFKKSEIFAKVRLFGLAAAKFEIPPFFISNDVILFFLKLNIMGFIKEFRAFAFKGNIIDLAVAVIIGAAFGAIISSLVDDVITPLLLNPAMEAAGVTDLDQLARNGVKYGKFLAAIIKFILVALVLFIIIKAANRFSAKEAIVAGPSSTDILLTEIRDELRKKNDDPAKSGAETYMNP